MKKGGSKFLIILIIVAVIGFGLFNTYNGLVVTEEKVNQAYADLQTAVQRRADLIPNLVNTPENSYGRLRLSLSFLYSSNNSNIFLPSVYLGWI